MVELDHINNVVAFVDLKGEKENMVIDHNKEDL